MPSLLDRASIRAAQKPNASTDAPRYAPNEYDPIDVFTQREEWEDEGFGSYDEYQAWYTALAAKCLEASENKWREQKKRWFKVYRRIEQDDLLKHSVGMTARQTDIPFMTSAVEDIIAALTESVPIPSVASRQAVEDDMASGLNYMLTEVLDQNNYEGRMFDMTMDMVATNLGVMKQTIAFSGSGPFGRPGRIIMRRTDPRHCWPDPFASSLSSDWDDFEYFICAEPVTTAYVREFFPERGALVMPESLYTEDGHEDRDSQAFTTPFNQDLPYAQGERHRAVLKEFWLKDRRKVKKPLLDGNLQPIKNRDGEVIYREFLKYPNGRVLWVANNVLLRDIPNPFNHGHIPYSFFKLRISSDILTFGVGELLMYMEDKMNMLSKDMFGNALFNMNSPFLCDVTAFQSRDDAENLVIEPGLIIFKNPGGQFTRLQPSEMPAFVLPLSDFFAGCFDEISGISSLNQGQLQKGAQLSADAVVQVGAMGGGRSRLRSRLFEMATKEVGYQAQANIRELWPGNMSATVLDPSTQEPRELTWNNEDWTQDRYAIEVQAGSALPGAKQSFQNLAMTLYREDAVDRQFLFEALQIPSYQGVLKRMNDKDKLALYLGYLGSRKNKSGSAGRRQISGGV